MTDDSNCHFEQDSAKLNYRREISTTFLSESSNPGKYKFGMANLWNPFHQNDSATHANYVGLWSE